VRDALRGLTLRGRAMVALAAGLALSAFLLGQSDLLRVAVFIATLPLLSVILVSRTRSRIACARALSSTRVEVGSRVTSLVRLHNVSPLPSGLLLATDRVPVSLGKSPRFVLDRLEGRGRRDIRVPLSATRRGRFTIGPVGVRLVDPFGMCALNRRFTATDTLVVTPVVVPLSSVRFGSDWSGVGEQQSNAVSHSGEDDVVPREYRTGDDLRRVHWRASAKYGDLMVRREEQPWKARACVMLDVRTFAHAGAGTDNSFEWAVSAAASVAIHLLRRGFEVTLVDQEGRDIVGVTVDHSTGDTSGLILDALAAVTTRDDAGFGVSDPRMRSRLSEGTLVVITGGLGLEEAEALSVLRRGTSPAIALLCDARTWDEPATSGSLEALTLLQRWRWRAIRVPRGARVDVAWTDLARGRRDATVVPAPVDAIA